MLNAKSELFHNTPLSALDTAQKTRLCCSDPSYAPVFEAIALLASVLLEDIDSIKTAEILKKQKDCQRPSAGHFASCCRTIFIQEKKSRLSISCSLSYIWPQFGLWLWSLKANHLMFRLLELSESDAISEQKQTLELILTQSTLKMPADIKKRMEIFFLNPRESSTFFKHL